MNGNEWLHGIGLHSKFQVGLWYVWIKSKEHDRQVAWQTHLVYPKVWEPTQLY